MPLLCCLFGTLPQPMLALRGLLCVFQVIAGRVAGFGPAGAHGRLVGVPHVVGGPGFCFVGAS
eukprot:5077769-Pyramimonas_sp.AAC.1